MQILSNRQNICSMKYDIPTMTAEATSLLKSLISIPSLSREETHNNAAVRNMLLQRGIVPEQLPPVEDVKKVERRLKSEEKSLTKKQGTNKTSKTQKE